MLDFLRDIPWEFLIIACLTLGLAPFTPPHIVEKLVMLKNNELKKPLDIFDLLMHATPWLLLLAKAIVVFAVA